MVCSVQNVSNPSEGDRATVLRAICHFSTVDRASRQSWQNTQQRDILLTSMLMRMLLLLFKWITVSRATIQTKSHISVGIHAYITILYSTNHVEVVYLRRTWECVWCVRALEYTSCTPEWVEFNSGSVSASFGPLPHVSPLSKVPMIIFSVLSLLSTQSIGDDAICITMSITLHHHQSLAWTIVERLQWIHFHSYTTH